MTDAQTTLSWDLKNGKLAGNPKRLLIDGAWVPALSGRTFDSINPSTGRVIASLSEGDAADVDLAVAAARRAFEGPWRRFRPADRERILHQFADMVEAHGEELCALDVLDMGSPISRTKIMSAVGVLRYYAGWATKIHGETLPNSAPTPMFSYTLKQPVGVVASVIPWNGPITCAVWKLAPVLATGCTMVLKPAEEAALSSLRLGELLCQLDLPPGVINVITGFGATAGAALAGHPDVDKIAFTGSTETGRSILRAATSNLKRVSLELGGKSPNIIFADADLEAAIPGAAMAVFGNSGQICAAGSRVYVERKAYGAFVDGVGEFARTLRVGNPMEPETQIGPIVSQEQLERVDSYLDIGQREGARLVVGGNRLSEGLLADGYFVSPTVFAEVRDDMRIAREEIFGPVASIMPFDDVDEVISRANRSEFGLAGGVWTRDIGRAHRVAQEIKTGVMWVNTYSQYDPAVPFGGVKSSGWGNELSEHSLDEYLSVKAVWINTGG